MNRETLKSVTVSRTAGNHAEQHSMVKLTQAKSSCWTLIGVVGVERRPSVRLNVSRGCWATYFSAGTTSLRLTSMHCRSSLSEFRLHARSVWMRWRFLYSPSRAWLKKIRSLVSVDETCREELQWHYVVHPTMLYPGWPTGQLPPPQNFQKDAYLLGRTRSYNHFAFPPKFSEANYAWKRTSLAVLRQQLADRHRSVKNGKSMLRIPWFVARCMAAFESSWNQKYTSVWEKRQQEMCCCGFFDWLEVRN